MNLHQWQARIRAQLTKSTALVQRMAPDMTYASLATATILPVIMAVKGGDITALMGLYNLLGSVGAGLVTNLIQEWKDRDEAETLAELPQTITAQLAENDDAQPAFDKLINELETVRLTLKSGALTDPQAFVDALREELQTLGSQIVIEGDWVAGDKVAGDKVDGDKVGGDKVAGDKIGTQVNINQTPPDPNKPDPTQLRRAYLNLVFQQSDMLTLSGIDPSAKVGEAHLSLGAVYTYTAEYYPTRIYWCRD